MKVRHEDGLEMTTYGAWSQGHAVVDVPAEEVPVVVLHVCAEDPELGLDLNTAEGGKVSTGMAFRSWGERIRFAVEPLSETRSVVTATCRPAFLLGLTNWGRSEKYLYRFLSGLRAGRPTEASGAATGTPAPRRRDG